MNFFVKLLENIASKKFWVAVITFITYLTQKDPEQTWPLAVIAAIYIASQAYVDSVKVRNAK